MLEIQVANSLVNNKSLDGKQMTTEQSKTQADGEIIIEGLTRAGKPFRPSDWVDRMCSSYASFGEDRKLKYSPYLKPRVMNGVRCLAVDLKLKVVNPEGYAQLMHFAEENQLNVLDSNGNSIEVPH